MEKYQGVFLLSVRVYLGVHDGSDKWQFLKNIVGIKEENGKISDYKTGEIYDFINRDNEGRMITSRADVKEGNVYAIDSKEQKFENNKFYTRRQIDKFIDTTDLFSEEYKNTGKTRGKRLIK